MKRPRLRLIVASASVVITLGGTILTQAAGTKNVVSRIWSNRPDLLRSDESALNPQNWFDEDEKNGKTPGSKSTNAAKQGDLKNAAPTIQRPDLNSQTREYNAPQIIKPQQQKTVEVVRPQLRSDPFRNEPVPETANSDMVTARMPAPGRPSRPAPVPQTRSAPTNSSNTEAVSAVPQTPALSPQPETHTSTASTTLTDSAMAQSSSARSEKARLPRNAEPLPREAGVVRMDRLAPMPTSDPAASSPDITTNKNQFADEFDAEFQRLVKSAANRRPATATGDPEAVENADVPLLPDLPLSSDSRNLDQNAMRDRHQLAPAENLPLNAPSPRDVIATAQDTAESTTSSASKELKHLQEYLEEKVARDSAELGTSAPTMVREITDREAVSEHSLKRESQRVGHAMNVNRADSSLAAPSQETDLLIPSLSGNQFVSESSAAPPQESYNETGRSDFNSPTASPISTTDDSSQAIMQIVPAERQSPVEIQSSQASPLPPRVLSNMPGPAVPDNSPYRRLSFEEEMAIQHQTRIAEREDKGLETPPLFIGDEAIDSRAFLSGTAPIESAPHAPADEAPLPRVVDWDDAEVAEVAAPKPGVSWTPLALCGAGAFFAAAAVIRRTVRRRRSRNS